MKIEWDKQSNIIKVGKAEFSFYRKWKNSAEWTNYVFDKNDIKFRLATYSKNSKTNNKIASDALGCSRSTLFNHFNKLQLKVFVAPVYDILKKVAFSGRGFSQVHLKKIHKNLPVVRQVYNDKLYNILPVVVEHEESPQQLKKELKGAWKVIANNSLNKNKALANAAKRHQDLNRLQKLAHLPTTVLKNFNHAGIEELEYIALHFKGMWNKTVDINNQLYILRDTIRMANKLGENVNLKWTPRRLKEEHDRMAREITARKYSKDQFESTKNISVKSISIGDYTAVLLESAFDVAEEGNVMGHCVAGYADHVREGNYLVYSVMKNGQKVSTIGIQKGKMWYSVNDADKNDWALQQHYGRFNASVDNEDEKKLGSEIVKMLNEKST